MGRGGIRVGENLKFPGNLVFQQIILPEKTGKNRIINQKIINIKLKPMTILVRNTQLKDQFIDGPGPIQTVGDKNHTWVFFKTFK